MDKNNINLENNIDLENNTTKNGNGFIYIVSNNVGGINNVDYIREALFSAVSLRKYHDKNEFGISIITDEKNKNYLNNITNQFSKRFSDFFCLKNTFQWDHIITSDMSLRCKQHLLYNNSPYDNTVFIDSDTLINWNLKDLFQLLNNFDILGVYDYSRKRYFDFLPDYNNIPSGFSEINTGLIAFKKCKAVSDLFSQWSSLYDHYLKIGNLKWDQPSFRVALWNSINNGLKFYSLPTEYNRRSKDTKLKCINLKKQGDTRFGKEHLKTRVFHFHNIENIFIKYGNKSMSVIEQIGQDF
jgi:hypothetical protein